MSIRMQQPFVRVADTSIAKMAPKVAAPVYQTADHKRWRQLVIARSGGRCQGKGPHSASRLYADHIVEIRDGGAPLDLANGQALCAACHTRKTNEARASRMRRNVGGGGQIPTP